MPDGRKQDEELRRAIRESQDGAEPRRRGGMFPGPPALPTEQKGLYGKYVITKADGSPTAPEADYFVLRLDTDPAARHAARTYARNIQSKNPTLAKDLRARCDRWPLGTV